MFSMWNGNNGKHHLNEDRFHLGILFYILHQQESRLEHKQYISYIMVLYIQHKMGHKNDKDYQLLYTFHLGMFRSIYFHVKLILHDMMYINLL